MPMRCGVPVGTGFGDSHSIIKGFRDPSCRCCWDTPMKLNMEPENKSLENESPFGNHDFQVPC